MQAFQQNLRARLMVAFALLTLLPLSLGVLGINGINLMREQALVHIQANEDLAKSDPASVLGATLAEQCVQARAALSARGSSTIMVLTIACVMVLILSLVIAVLVTRSLVLGMENAPPSTC